MSIYRRIEKYLLAQFNTKNGHSLLPEHVKFKNPRPADSVDLAMAAVYNTAISLEMQKGSPFDGVATLFYNRVVLSSEFAVSRLVDLNFIKIKNEKTIHDILPYINTKLGLHLDPSDVYDDPLNDYGLFSQVRVRIMDHCLEFTGSFDMGIMRVDAPLAKPTIRNSVVFLEDTGRKGVYAGRPEYPVFPLTFGIDYTAASFYLKQIPVPDAWGAFALAYPLQAAFPTDPAMFASALNQVDNLGWRSDINAAATLTVAQAMPLYNGPTKNCTVPSYAYLGVTGETPSADVVWSNPANTKYDNVLVMMIHNPWYSTNRYKSLALFHYNEVRA